MHLLRPLALLFAAVALAWPLVAGSADHGDTPLLRAVARHDARIGDLFAFVRGGDLILALTVDPTVPPGVEEYAFPSDVKYRLFIDHDSPVSFDDPRDRAEFGGTIVRPERIREDIRFQVQFHKNGHVRLSSEGLSRRDAAAIELFTGLRDDPFIRAPRAGRNIAAIVLRLPLSAVLARQSTLLLWATTMVPELRGGQQELAGRALRSQFAENDLSNSLHPSEHRARLGVAPDVVILDTSRPAGYPNGRELSDDVVDLVCFAPEAECRVYDQEGEGAEGPTQNDVPFLSDFPFLAPPQLP